MYGSKVLMSLCTPHSPPYILYSQTKKPPRIGAAFLLPLRRPQATLYFSVKCSQLIMNCSMISSRCFRKMGSGDPRLRK